MGYSQIQDGIAFALLPPPVLGLGNANGLEFYVEDRGAIGYGELYAQTMGLVGALGATPGFNPYATFTSYQSNVPQLDATVDRTRVKELGLALTDVFNTLQIYLGSAYVNDFNLFGRTYSVYAQADAPYRATVQDIQGLKVRNNRGEMVPLQRLRGSGHVRGTQSRHPFLDRRAREGSCNQRPAIAARHGNRVDGPHLPAGDAGQYGALRVPAVRAAGLPRARRALRELVAAARDHPDRAAVPAVRDRRHLARELHPRDVARGVLIGLACKNAILIVEFARDLEEQGRGIVDAAIEACRLRLRPILMTSFAFIAGVLPLVFASGAGSEVRYVMGVTVVAGMLGVTFFGLFFTPVFYVVLRRMVERQKERRRHA
jgi:multidrug efflux pump